MRTERVQVDALSLAARVSVLVPGALPGLKDGVAPLFEKDATDDAIGSAGPDDIDLDVARDAPHQVNAVAEARQSAGVEHRVGVGIHDLNGFASSVGVPIQGVERELMGVAVGEIHVEVERAAAIPYRGNSPRATPGLQRSGIAGAGSPNVISLVLNRKRSVVGNTLRLVSHRISIGSVDAVPTALRAGIGCNEGCGRPGRDDCNRRRVGGDGVCRATAGYAHLVYLRRA